MFSIKHFSFNDVKDKSILLLLDSNCLVIHGKIDKQKIKSLSLFLTRTSFNQLTINDRLGHLELLLKKTSFSGRGGNKRVNIIFQEFETIDFLKFEAILSPYFYIEELERVLKKKYSNKQYAELKIFNFNPLHRSYNQIVNQSGQTVYQETLFPKTIKKILKLNSTFSTQPVKNVIVLDDHCRDFYIGDTCLWLATIRQIQQKTNCEKITVVIENTQVFQKIVEIFSISPFPNFNFTILKWEELNLSRYDMAIIHQDSILKFLTLLNKKGKSINIPKKGTYRFSPYFSHSEINIPHPWDINHYLKAYLTKSQVFLNLKRTRKQKHKEIPVFANEISYANQWLIDHGYQTDKRLFVIIDEASSSKKALSFSNNALLIQSIVQNKQNQVLLFDYKSENKKEKLLGYLGPDMNDKIITATQLGIRKEMGILASPYINCIIGPCTGLMHLANGIITFLANDKYLKREKLPFLMVYTGSGFDLINYHPRYWWENSKVKCIVPVKEMGGIIIKEIKEISGKVSDFQKKCAGIDQLSIHGIINYINSNNQEKII